MRTINVLLICFLTFSATAGDWKSDLNGIKARYSASSSYESVMDYNVYIDEVLFQTAPAVMKFKEGSYHLKTEDLEVFSNTKFNLTVKPSRELLIIGPSNTSKGIAADIDSLEKFIDRVETRILKNGYKVHRIYHKQGKTAWTELEFNPETFELKIMRKENRFTQELANGDYGTASLEVVFKSIEMGVNFSANDFSGSKYVINSSENIKTTDSFSSYQLINLITNQ